MEDHDKEITRVCMCIPKAELHIHIEGTLEPEMIFELSKRNNVNLSYKTPEEIREKFKFKDLQSFLDIYYASCSVLITEQDFFELIYAYLKKASSQGLKYAEIFFDPQTHLQRNIEFSVFMDGFKRGLEKARADFNVDAQLIMCFQRHLSEEDALNTLKLSAPYRESILGIGLDSSEKGFPPELFKNIYALAKEQGFRLVAHAGEEGPSKNIETSIDLLKVERIDHGIAVLESKELMKRCGQLQIPFTLCPLSNIKLCVISDLTKYPLKKLIDNNLLVTVNSDDPSYFGGYIGDNYIELQKALDLSLKQIVILAENSFKASFMSDERKEYYLSLIKDFTKDLDIN